MEIGSSTSSQRKRRSSAALIVRRAFSRRTAINEFQVQHFCELCRLLVRQTLDHFGVEICTELPEDGWESFIQLPEYGLFVSGAYACGFVCSDLSPAVDLESIKSRYAKALGEMDLPHLRHYLHALMRSERAGYGGGSVLYDALCEGALEFLCGRLERDPDFYECL